MMVGVVNSKEKEGGARIRTGIYRVRYTIVPARASGTLCSRADTWEGHTAPPHIEDTPTLLARTQAIEQQK